MRRAVALGAFALLAAGCAKSAPPATTSSSTSTSSTVASTTTSTTPPGPQTDTFRIDQPYEGQLLAGLPVVVRGTANTFEATFIAELQTPSSDVLDHVVVHASAGTGTWGTFEVSLGAGLGVSGPEVVVLYENSAKDGQPIHQLRIPVVIRATGTTP